MLYVSAHVLPLSETQFLKRSRSANGTRHSQSLQANLTSTISRPTQRTSVWLSSASAVQRANVSRHHPDLGSRHGRAYERDERHSVAVQGLPISQVSRVSAWVQRVSKSATVSVWKPLRGPIQDWPLALCDPSTLGAADVRKSDSVFSTIEVEYYLVHPSADQKWYYLSNQTSSEAWVFLQADSQPRDVCGTSRPIRVYSAYLQSV